MAEERLEAVAAGFGWGGQLRRCGGLGEVLEPGVREGEPRLDLCSFLSGWQRCGVVAYCCDVFSQALGLVPGVCLFSRCLTR